MAAMGNLHGRCIVITVGDNDFNTEALQLDNDLLAKLAASTQQYTGGSGG